MSSHHEADMGAGQGAVRSPRARIVVPCYNEEERLDSSAFDAYLKETDDIDFVFVNDGSTDGTLAQLQALNERWHGRALVVDQQPNQGKGEAVRVGLVRAIDEGAELIGYWDADLATPLEAIRQFVEVLERRTEINVVLGSRVALLGRKIYRRAGRHYSGRLFAFVVRHVLAVHVYDTQCGAKLLRNTASIRSILASSFRSRWIFDVELVARYLQLTGDRDGLYEIPLDQWRSVSGSKLRAVDYLRAISDLAGIYWFYRIR